MDGHCKTTKTCGVVTNEWEGRNCLKAETKNPTTRNAKTANIDGGTDEIQLIGACKREHDRREGIKDVAIHSLAEGRRSVKASLSQQNRGFAEQIRSHHRTGEGKLRGINETKPPLPHQFRWPCGRTKNEGIMLEADVDGIALAPATWDSNTWHPERLVDSH
ncbi:hypothetical protein R1flu_004739 [Riccia fluitans]|uniref:Uncharacterized protein n=1 Tax=Riccia fluitans TaxID=41844 RepID=A0ABD1YR58_9MARC